MINIIARWGKQASNSLFDYLTIRITLCNMCVKCCGMRAPVTSQQTHDVDTIMVYCWGTVCAGQPALGQRRPYI